MGLKGGEGGREGGRCFQMGKSVSRLYKKFELADTPI